MEHAFPAPRGSSVQVVPLRPDGLVQAGRRQHVLLPDGFFSALGPGFLVRYLETYLHGPVAVALAVEHDGRQVGHLVGTVGPGHNRWAVRSCWRRLLSPAALALLRHPRVLLEFVRTRAGRYAHGVLAAVRARPAAPAHVGSGPAALMHVAVDVDARGGGAGAALVTAFEDRARTAGCPTARLVTFADAGAGAFYTRLGWSQVGERTGADGRLVLVYERSLADGGGPR